MAHAHWQLLRVRAQTLLDPFLPAYDSTGKLERNKVLDEFRATSEDHPRDWLGLRQGQA